MPAPPQPDRLPRRRAIGEQIRAARIHAGLSRQPVAEQAGISLDNLGRIERGQASPTLDTLLGIADAIGVPLALLVREEPRPASTGDVHQPGQ
ncbi:helix-turn-helix domain-containing protein [Streptomyces sp. NPDC058405]|uniref:helix-turn-helix domain-containing protein n=1 Tax=Streptomyces sp. NPDC058405 TaxID=3346482 RepID=UPI003658B30B